MQSEKIVVLDFDIPQLMNNKIFDRVEAFKISHTILPTCYLYEQALKQGIKLVTSDVFFNMPDKSENPLMISALNTPNTAKLIQAKAKPIILLCQESPFIATRFYLNLRRISAAYKHSFVFSGMKRWLSKKTIYHQMFFPEAFNFGSFQNLPFSQKKLITMISGNKRIGNWKKTLIIKAMYGLGIQEIYEQRQKAINIMARRGGFDLYGVGWDKGGLSPEDTENIKKVYRGKVDSKTETLRQYKFAFCFENSIFPGYVTEKIFDVMFAGCVPVYNGAPDIKDFVPKNCFLDVRDFKNYDQLAVFLENMTETEYNQYVDNIKKYLTSPEFNKFSQETFAGEILSILEAEFNAQ